MIKLTEIITQDNILLDCHISSKKRAFEMLSKLLAEQTNTLVYQAILVGLVEREKLGSTAIGHGIALPHARLDELDKPIAAIVRLYPGEGLTYDDDHEDDKVDVLFGLIVPHTDHEAHLQLLANIAAHFRDKSFRHAFRAAKDPTDAQSLFSTE